jgi:hypothetical protein
MPAERAARTGSSPVAGVGTVTGANAESSRGVGGAGSKPAAAADAATVKVPATMSGATALSRERRGLLRTLVDLAID